MVEPILTVDNDMVVTVDYILTLENGEVVEACDDNCKGFQKEIQKAKKIEGTYGNGGWKFKAEIPHAEFDIFEDGELYGKGIVFDIESLKN